MIGDCHANSPNVAAGMRTFLNVAERWKLTKNETLALLNESDPSRWDAWIAGEVGGLSSEQIIRLSLTLGIYQGVNTELAIPERADAWIRRANSVDPFAGRTALALMMSGTTGDLKSVRRYLDAQIT